jgi:hypothetical protein
MLDPSKQAKPAKLTRRDVTTTAFCIERDLRGVVETLKRTTALVDPSDKELVAQLASTKSVAERGLRLSKLLLKLTRKPLS